MTNPDEPAFSGTNAGMGLTKREYFAAVGLAAIYGNQHVCDAIHKEFMDTEEKHSLHFFVAAAAVAQANALIEALNYHETKK